MKVFYPTDKSVSIWVGNFLTEDDFDKSVNTEVVKRLGLSTEIESICEVAFEQKPVPLRQLIEGFSGWETFIEPVQAAAASQGLSSANAALVCYYVRCEDASSDWGPLRFLGTFVGQDAS